VSLPLQTSTIGKIMRTHYLRVSAKVFFPLRSAQKIAACLVRRDLSSRPLQRRRKIVGNVVEVHGARLGAA
jgi:hypothetical protein